MDRLTDSSDTFRGPSDKYLSLPEGKSFWSEGHYDTVVKRIENGRRSLNDFLLMVGERAAIERRYADRLHSWFDKWSSTIFQGPEYGVVQTVWQSILTEGRKFSDIHFHMSQGLGLTQSYGLQQKIYKFKKANYHNLPLHKGLKEVKECKEAFKAIQAPFKKAMENINKARKKFLELSKSCVQLSNKMKERQTFGSITESLQKSRLESQSESKEKAKSKYIESINFFNDNINEKYTAEMKAEFQRCQDFESERMKVLLNCLHDYIGIVNQQTHTREPLSSIYSQAVSPLITAQPENNLSLFSRKYGAAMPQRFPNIKDVSMDAELKSEPTKWFSSAAKLDGSVFGSKGPNMLLNRLKYLRSETQLHFHARSSTKEFMLRRPSDGGSLTDSARNSEFRGMNTNEPKRSFDSAMLNVLTSQAEEEEEQTPSSTEHYFMNNVYVRAVQNFTASHKNHLQIRKGEVIYQIRGDEKGWCYGRIAHTEGAYPSKAVTLLSMNVVSI